MAGINRTFLTLAFFMILTGSINTITTKFADITKSKGIDGEVREFNHPFVQALGMFLGEFLCLVAFRVSFLFKKSDSNEAPTKPFNPIIFLIPALCDMTATSAMYVGLTLTYASVFQMLRGSVVIFTGIFSVIFLKKKLNLQQWVGMLFVLLGLGCVGLASVLSKTKDSHAPNPLLGNVIIIAAQMIVASQMVVEEKFLSNYDMHPLQVVGWEGIWGITILGILLVPFYFIPGSVKVDGKSHFEHAPDAFVQIGNSAVIACALLGNILSISFFNFFGISITKYASATHRTVLDSIRTIIIWGFSLLMKWQEFQALQVTGFLLLLNGTFIYNEVLLISFLQRKPKGELEEVKQPLLEDEKSIN